MNTHFCFRNKEASPSSARHCRTRVVLLVLAAALLAILLTAWVLFGTQLKAALTCWSWVYNQQERTALFYDTEDWEHPYTLSLRGAEWLSQ